MRVRIILIRVSLDLVLESVVTDTISSIDNILNKRLDLIGVFGQTEDKVAGNGRTLVVGKVLVIEVRNLVQVAEFAEGAKEVISRDGGLALEAGEPEDLGILGSQMLAHFAGQIVVHDVLEIDFVQIIGPWVQHGEALVLDALDTVLLDVLLEEFESRFISGDRVAEIILDDRLLRVTDERADGLDARA